MIKHPPVIMFLAKAFQTDPRPRQEAKSLADASYSVFVLAWDRERAFPRLENVDGVTVRSFSPVNLQRFSVPGLVLGGIMFQVLILLWTTKLIGRLGRRPIIHAHDFNTLLPGCLLRMSHLSIGLVYDSHELSYAAYSEFFNSAIGGVVRCVEAQCLRYVDTIITVSDPFADYLRRFNDTIEVLYNCPRALDIPTVSKREARRELGLPQNAFIVSYIGSIRSDFALDLLLAAACLTSHENIWFVVVGDGPLFSELREMARHSNARLSILAHVSREKALRYVLASDLTWAVYQSRSLNMRLTMPWKFFESLACRVPVIVEEGSLRAELVGELGCGVISKGEDPHQVSHLIESLARNRQQYQRICAPLDELASWMTWEAMSQKLVEAYELLGSSHTGEPELVHSRNP